MVARTSGVIRVMRSDLGEPVTTRSRAASSRSEIQSPSTRAPNFATWRGHLDYDHPTGVGLRFANWISRNRPPVSTPSAADDPQGAAVGMI